MLGTVARAEIESYCETTVYSFLTFDADCCIVVHNFEQLHFTLLRTKSAIHYSRLPNQVLVRSPPPTPLQLGRLRLTSSPARLLNCINHFDPSTFRQSYIEISVQQNVLAWAPTALQNTLSSALSTNAQHPKSLKSVLSTWIPALVFPHLSLGAYTALEKCNSKTPHHRPPIPLLSTKTPAPMAHRTPNCSLITSRAAFRRRDTHSKVIQRSRVCITNNSRMARHMVTMRITVAIIVAEGEGPRKDYARLWQRVWLVVAAWISVSSKVKWRKGERGRKNMHGGRRIIRVSKPQTGKGGDWQGRKA